MAPDGLARGLWTAGRRAPGRKKEAAEDVLPDGVLGYGVGVFSGATERFSGLTHTGGLSLESARKEADAYTATARNAPFNPGHGKCRYLVVEIREAGSA